MEMRGTRMGYLWESQKEEQKEDQCTLLDNIKMDVGEMRSVAVGWIDLAQDRDKWVTLVNMVMNIRVP
jgi:hypothetical protein